MPHSLASVSRIKVSLGLGKASIGAKVSFFLRVSKVSLQLAVHQNVLRFSCKRYRGAATSAKW